MKTAVLILILTAITICGAQICGIVTDVHDGDTVTVKEYGFPPYGGTKFKIRLNGIDAPELDQFYGYHSKMMLAFLVLNKPVIVKFNKIEVYGRILGDIYDGQININKIMLSRGMAYMSNYSHDSELKTLEEEAKQKKSGLWLYEGLEKPWTYRKSKKKK